MKCDRRWYNDGRLEREQQAWSDRDKAPPDAEAILLAAAREALGDRLVDGCDVDVCRIGDGYSVRMTPRGAKLRVTLP